MAKKFDFSTMHLSDIPKFIVALFKGELGEDEEMMKGQTGFYEINLVPDIKTDMIKNQKMRNLVFFICIVTSVVSVSTALILGSIKGAQDITMAGQDAHMKNLSDKIKSYEELPEFLTIQNQLRGISEIEDNQKVLSRAIIFLAALRDLGEDEVKVSELSVDLTTSTLSFDAQADAKKDNIDYRVLEAFIKRTNMMTFDYGRYVDSTGNEIPSRCIEEYDKNNVMLQESGSLYAIWHRGEKGCDPTRDDYAMNENGTITSSTINVDLEAAKMVNGTSDVAKVKTEEEKKEETKKTTIEYIPSEKVYRTPQFTSWYKKEPVRTIEDGIDDAIPEPPDEGTVYNVTNYKYTPEMDENGAISGIPHFESKCITYTGRLTVDESTGEENMKWSAENICMLVPDGITVTESANGRDQDDRLVLRFSAVIQLNADAFAFRNKHVMAIGPNGQNVTDSYVQLEKIFDAPATACKIGDTECNNTPTSGTGE